MLKPSFIAALCLTIVACTTASPKQFYRPAGAEQQLIISGSFEQFSFEHTVTINDEVAVTGKLAYNYAPAKFTGQYNGMTVTSDCHWKKKVDLFCLVQIDGENAANLSF